MTIVQMSLFFFLFPVMKVDHGIHLSVDDCGLLLQLSHLRRRKQWMLNNSTDIYLMVEIVLNQNKFYMFKMGLIDFIEVTLGNHD